MNTIYAAGLTSLIRSAPAVPVSLTCRETLRVMFQHPESKCIVVCNSANEPVGLLMCERFFLKATGRMGMDHFYREPVARLMNRKPLTADINTSLESVRAEAAKRPEPLKNDCVIVTRNGTFSGVLYLSDLPPLPL